MASFDMKDLDQAVIGFREHARSFGADRAIAAGRLLGAVVGPFVDWLSSMSDIVSFFVYRVGGYDCIGFRVGGVSLKGVPLYGGNLLNRSQYLSKLLSAATGKPVLSLNTEIPDVRGVRLDLQLLHICPRVPQKAKAVSDRGKPMIWTVSLGGVVKPWLYVSACARFLVARGESRGLPVDVMSTAVSLPAFRELLANEDERAKYFDESDVESDDPQFDSLIENICSVSSADHSSHRTLNIQCKHVDRRPMPLPCTQCEMMTEMCLACLHPCVVCASVSREGNSVLSVHEAPMPPAAEPAVHVPVAVAVEDPPGPKTPKSVAAHTGPDVTVPVISVQTFSPEANVRPQVKALPLRLESEPLPAELEPKNPSAPIRRLRSPTPEGKEPWLVTSAHGGPFHPSSLLSDTSIDGPMRKLSPSLVGIQHEALLRDLRDSHGHLWVHPWTHAPDQNLSLACSDDPSVRIAQLAYVFSLVPRCRRVGGEMWYTPLWKLIQCAAPPSGQDYHRVVASLCTRRRATSEVFADPVLVPVPDLPCPTDALSMASDVFARAPDDFLAKLKDYEVDFLGGSVIEEHLVSDFFLPNGGAPGCVYVPSDMFLFQSRNYAIVGRVRLLLPSVIPDVFSVMSVVYHASHFTYIAVRVDRSHPLGVYCVVGDSLRGHASMFAMWETILFRLSLLLHAVVRHYDLPRCGNGTYDVFVDSFATQNGSDCWIFAGPFAARRLCEAKIGDDGRLWMPSLRADYRSKDLRKRIWDQLHLSALLAAPVGWASCFPRNPSNPSNPSIAVLPRYVPNLTRDGVQIFSGVLSGSVKDSLYRAFARDRASSPPWIRSHFGQSRSRAERLFLLQAKRSAISRIGGAAAEHASEAIYGALRGLGLSHPSLAPLMGVNRVDAFLDSSTQLWHRDYPWSGDFLPVPAAQQPGAFGHLYEVTVNVTPVRIHMAAIAGSHAVEDGNPTGPPLLLPMDPGDMVIMDMLTVHRGLAYIGNAKDFPPTVRLMASQVFKMGSEIGQALADAWDERERKGASRVDAWEGSSSEFWGEPDTFNVDILGNICGPLPPGLHFANPSNPRNPSNASAIVPTSPLAPSDAKVPSDPSVRASESASAVFTSISAPVVTVIPSMQIPPLPDVDPIDGLELCHVMNCFGRYVGVGVRAVKAFAKLDFLGSYRTARAVTMDKRNVNHPWVWQVPAVTRGVHVVSAAHRKHLVEGIEAGPRDMLRFLDEGLSQRNVVARVQEKTMWFQAVKDIQPGEWVLTTYVTGTGSDPFSRLWPAAAHGTKTSALSKIQVSEPILEAFVTTQFPDECKRLGRRLVRGDLWPFIFDFFAVEWRKIVRRAAEALAERHKRPKGMPAPKKPKQKSSDPIEVDDESTISEEASDDEDAEDDDDDVDDDQDAKDIVSEDDSDDDDDEADDDDFGAADDDDDDDDATGRKGNVSGSARPRMSAVRSLTGSRGSLKGKVMKKKNSSNPSNPSKIPEKNLCRL